MKDLCNRDETTSHISVGSSGSIEMVNRFKDKFLKEARNIARLNHQHIVRILDVFEENGTAYYVMEYAEGGSLAEKVKRCGALPESEAVRYILQVADALGYIHEQKMNHLDIKPANIMLNAKDDAILIDFGLSKQYDAVTGSQTSTTPVGISEGYAPMEQYKQGGVGEFSPETDIYALGATLFKLLTGITPPSASDINEDGVPVAELKVKGVSQSCIDAICKAMEGRKKDRIKQVGDFIKYLNLENHTEGTTDIKQEETREGPTGEYSENKDEEETKVASDAKLARQRKKKNKTNRTAQGIKSLIRKNIVGFVCALCFFAFALVVGFAIDFSNEKEYRHAYEASKTEIQTIDTIVDEYGHTRTREVLEYRVNGVSFDMIKVEGGTFRMGATHEQGSDANDNEKPVRRITISDFYIGKTEVTQALWQAVMCNNPSNFKEDLQRPVECVSWNDCQKFIKKLNQLTGKTFSLPTEAQWEYAARGGKNSRGYKYSGGNDLESMAWYNINSKGTTHPVATKQANELGLYDMSGNVMEWCQNWYDLYSSASQSNPLGRASARGHVLRGGSWRDDSRDCRVSSRSLLLVYQECTSGLRLASPSPSVIVK